MQRCADVRRSLVAMGLLTSLCLLSACRSEVSDAEILKLLGDGANLSRISPETLECLETVSGTNTAATAALASEVREARKDECRSHLQARLDNPGLNVARLGLRNLTRPELVKRIMDIANKQEVLFRDGELAAEATSRLETASRWLVLQGAGAPLVHDKDRLDDALLAMGVNLWVTPVIVDDQSWALFRLKSHGLNWDLMLLQRLELAGMTYEQWATPISGREWAGINSDYRFYLVKESGNGERELLASGSQYAEVFLSSNQAATFDMTDLWIRYRLSAWEFPAHFEGTDLASTEVYYQESGVLAQRPARLVRSD